MTMSAEDQPTSVPTCRGSDFCTSVATSTDARCKEEEEQALYIRHVSKNEAVIWTTCRHRSMWPAKESSGRFQNIGDDVGGGPADIGADMPQGDSCTSAATSADVCSEKAHALYIIYVSEREAVI